jgi:hypothetical protein
MMKTPFEGIPSQSVDEEELTKITNPKKSQWSFEFCVHLT